MTCWRESTIRRTGEADKMTRKPKRPEKEALSGTSCDRGRYGDGYGDVSATISATSHRCDVTPLSPSNGQHCKNKAHKSNALTK
jgi:hypothetical protein